MRVLFLGDIVGDTGREAVETYLAKTLEVWNPGLVIANGENAAAGRGMTRKIAERLFDLGIDIFTMGNHVWDNKDIFSFIDEDRRIVRPANYPEGTPGRGYTLVPVGGKTVAVINVMGRAFMGDYGCPFRKLDEILHEIESITTCVVVDVHAETTSEKLAIGWYLSGRVSAVLGTHTHVQTADERVLSGGTAYLTDVGMVGAADGVLGMRKDQAIQKFLTLMPVRFEVATGALQFCAVVVDIDQHGRAQRIERIRYVNEDLPKRNGY